MFPAQRRARILEHLRLEESASLRELSDKLKISLSTIRRDVDYLCETGHLQRTHGGAILEASALLGFEPEPEIASAMASAEKKAIGMRAAALIRPGQSVIFDSGSTTAAAALAARDRNIPFTAVTNDLQIGTILSASPVISTTVTGGQVRSGSTTLLGATTAGMLAGLHADIAFIGTHALTQEHLADTSPELAEIKKIILKSAELVVLLADSGKFFTSAFCTFGKLTDVDLVITDDRLSLDHAATIGALGVPMEIVTVNASEESSPPHDKTSPDRR
jgi:DeoR/GlpR family transcriptional regulator of sugar metabolism